MKTYNKPEFAISNKIRHSRRYIESLTRYKKIALLLIIIFTITGIFLVNGISSTARAEVSSSTATATPPTATTEEGGGGGTSILGIVANKVVGPAVRFLLSNVIAPFLRTVIWVFAKLIAFAININSQLFNPNNAFIQDSWKTTRDVANLGFVLIIIVIAFATILRIEAYGVKKALTKLIIAALLVNFSLMICAAIFDISNIATNVFIKSFGNADGISNKLADVFGVSNVANSSLEKSVAEQYGSFATGSIVGPIFIIIFFIIIIITLAALFIMLLIRYVWLGLLVILSPLAWLCSILPATAKWWKEWWQQFMRWIIFAPAMMFFLYLALNSSDGTKAFIDHTMKESTSFASGFGSTIGNLFIMTGLLLGGLMIANKLGITGAAQFNKWAIDRSKGVGAWAGARAAGVGRLASTRALQTTQAKDLATKFKSAGAGQQGKLRGIARWALAPVRKTGTGMTAAHSKLVISQAETAKKNYKELSKDDWVNINRTGNAEEQMATFNLLKETESLNKLNPADIKRNLNNSNRFNDFKNAEKAVNKQVPHLSPIVAEAIDKTKALTEALAETDEENYGKQKFSDAIENDPVQRETITRAILNNSSEDVRLLSKTISSLNGKLKDKLQEEAVRIIKADRTKDPNAHNGFLNISMNSRDIRISKIADKVTTP